MYVRIDRRRKLPATIVLKALGYSNEELLKTFYPIEHIRIKTRIPISAQRAKCLRASGPSRNILGPDGKEVIVKEGSKITKNALKKLDHYGIKEIAISRSEIVGRVTLSDIVDPATGEIILDGNKEISEDIFHKIVDAKITELPLLSSTM